MTRLQMSGCRLPKGALAISKARHPPTSRRSGAVALSEVKFLVFFTLSLCVVTTLPYVVGHLMSFPGTIFTDVLGRARAMLGNLTPWPAGPDVCTTARLLLLDFQDTSYLSLVEFLRESCTLCLVIGGMTSFFLAFSVWRLRRGRLGETGRLMVCCLLTAILFAHAHHFLHFSFQFATNILVPLVMIVLVGLEKPITEWNENWRWARVSIITLLVANSFTSIALVGQAVLLTVRGDFRADGQLLDSYSWLNARSRADDVVLADFENSNHMPQYTHNVVFCGYDNAVEFGDKLRDLQQFFDPKTATEFRKRLIQQNAIQFVLLTAAEQQDIAAIGEVPFLREVFRNNAAVIFSVTDVRSERRIPGTRKTDSML